MVTYAQRIQRDESSHERMFCLESHFHSTFSDLHCERERESEEGCWLAGCGAVGGGAVSINRLRVVEEPGWEKLEESTTTLVDPIRSPGESSSPTPPLASLFLESHHHHLRRRQRLLPTASSSLHYTFPTFLLIHHIIKPTLRFC